MARQEGLTIWGGNDTIYGNVMFKEADVRDAKGNTEKTEHDGYYHLMTTRGWKRWAKDAEIVGRGEL
jgi:hypothetical protein